MKQKEFKTLSEKIAQLDLTGTQKFQINQVIKEFIRRLKKQLPKEDMQLITSLGVKNILDKLAGDKLT